MIRSWAWLLVLLVLVTVQLWVRFSNPDMTTTRLLINYWQLNLVTVLIALIGLGARRW